MPVGYGQLCPIAHAAELLAERRTLLVVRELLAGSTRYSEVPDKKRAWWLVAQRSGTDLCLCDPGSGVDLRVDAEPRAMAEVRIGTLALGAAMRSRRVRVSGPERLVWSLPRWLGRNAFAYPDPAAVLAETTSARARA
jgi:hypothetical protein